MLGVTHQSDCWKYEQENHRTGHKQLLVCTKYKYNMSYHLQAQKTVMSLIKIAGNISC